MKNPWKEKSKVSPQREKGNRQIANDVYLALLMAPLSCIELKVAMFIIHMTWGMGKLADAIAYSQFVTAVRASERHIKRAVAELIRMRVLVVEESGRVTHGSPLNAYMLNKYYDTWTVWTDRGVDLVGVLEACGKLVGKWGRGVTFSASRGDILGKRGVTPASPSKESSQKKYSKGFEIEDLLKAGLNGTAKLDQVVRVMHQVEPRQWWRVEKFLRHRYPGDNSGEKVYLAAERAITIESDLSPAAKKEAGLL